jgi:hypothetical protein
MVIARFGAALACAAAIASCARAPVTEIAIVSDTDLAVPSGLDAIEIRVMDARGTVQTARADLAAGAPLPVTLGLVSDGGQGTLDVAVIGELAGAEILRRSARVSFVYGRMLSLELDLLGRCVDVSCEADATCGEDGCRAVAIAPSELVPFSGSPVGVDASHADAATADATGAGDASTTECAGDGDCDDGITCTMDACNGGRCEHAPNASACDDGMACTTDACDASTGCTYQTNDDRCDDRVACTTDVCDRLLGCTHTPVHTTCSDGHYCDVMRGCAGAPGFGMVYSMVISSECAPCHTESPVSGDLDLTTQSIAYASLVGVAASCGAGANTRVIPRDSLRSLLWRKVSGVDLCGAQMPRLRTPLPMAQIDLIARWIDGGARP